MSVPAPMTDADPGQLGGYRLVGRLGRSRMEAVYLGEADDGNHVAVKMIRAEFAEDPRFVARFRREAESARKVVSPYTAQVLDVGVDGGRPYLVTEYIQGRTLSQELTSRKQEEKPSFSAAEVEQLAVAILTALVAIHAAGIVHRDLKPSNVLLLPTGPRIINFGIARALDASSVLTQGRSRVGTPGYMAPEQIRGEQVTQAADIFAWGATVAFAANGVGPFGAGDDVMDRTLDKPPDLGRLSPALRPLVEQALSKDPGRRPSARALRDKLEPGTPAESTSGPTILVPPPPPTPNPVAAPTPARRARPRILAAAAAAAAVVFAVAGALVVVNPFDRSEGTTSPSSPSIPGKCQHIDVFTGGVGAPYYRYGQTLRNKIMAAYPAADAEVHGTQGSSENLRSVADPVEDSCKIAVTQLNTAVDARYGIYQFEGEPIERLRTVGPLWFDFLQLIVREDSSIRTAADLCESKVVATGPPQSGTQQTGEVLFRQVREEVSGCTLDDKTNQTSLANGLNLLRTGKADAVFWAGGVPTAAIKDEIDKSGLRIRLIPLDGYRKAMQDDWDDFYRPRLRSLFVSADIYQIATISGMDYTGVEPTATLAIANGVAVNEAADPDLVRFVAQTLFRDRAAFEDALWGDKHGARNFQNAQETVGTNPLYCLVPLHSAAIGVYQDLHVNFACQR